MRNYKRFALWRLPETGRTLTTIISYWKRLQVISRQNGILKSVHSVAWKTDNPVMNLLRTFRENDRKISELTSLLKEMERNDVLEELQPYIGQWNAAYKLGRWFSPTFAQSIRWYRCHNLPQTTWLYKSTNINANMWLRQRNVSPPLTYFHRSQYVHIP